jgi:hypothetical protein
MRPKEFAMLFDLLKANTKLSYLNLSINTLFDSEQQTYETLTTENDILEIYPVEEKNTGLVDTKNIGETTLSPIDCLCKFMKHNTSLIHIDLTSANLSERIMMTFGKTLRRAR